METFILIVRYESLKIFLAITVILEMILLKINVVEANLESIFS